MAKQIIKRENVPPVEKIGIYAIHNKTNNKYYIGSSKNLFYRLLYQAHALNTNKLNKKICYDVKNNNCDFEFLILKTFEDGKITDRQLRSYENYYIGKYDSIEKGYNINLAVSTAKDTRRIYCRKYSQENKYLQKYF